MNVRLSSTAIAASLMLAAGATAQTTAPAPAAPATTNPAQTTAPAQTAPAAPTTGTAPATGTAPVAPGTPATGATTAAPTTTLAQALPTLPGRATLARLVKAAGLDAQLAGPGPFTVFAPSDDAFSRMPAGAIDSLSKPENKPALETIIKYHIVSGALTADQLKQQITAGGGTATLTTLAGQPLTAQLGPNGNIMLTDVNGQKAYVDQADVRATNGVAHLTNGISIPKIG